MSTTLATLKAALVATSSIGPYLTAAEIEEYCNDAASETGWAFPVSGLDKELWIKRRAKRNCFEALWLLSARKFKVDQLSLNQKFDHYGAVIKRMDEDFKAFIEERPELFTTVNPRMMFGTIAGHGLVYDIAGRDITDYSPPPEIDYNYTDE